MAWIEDAGKSLAMCYGVSPRPEPTPAEQNSSAVELKSPVDSSSWVQRIVASRSKAPKESSGPWKEQISTPQQFTEPHHYSYEIETRVTEQNAGAVALRGIQADVTEAFPPEIIARLKSLYEPATQPPTYLL